MKIENNKYITLNDINSVVFESASVSLSDASLTSVIESFEFLREFSRDKVIYGINTGLGPMAQYRIPKSDLKKLQLNLIRSHAAGVGESISQTDIKATMFVRLKAITQGKSGIHQSSVLLLTEMINRNIIPFVPSHGGVGASGDLVQLSHIALTMLGEGKVFYKGKLEDTKEVFKQEDLSPLTIELREGLSLINGTSVMTGIATTNLIKAKKLFDWQLLASCMLNEIVRSFDDHFSVELNQVKLHKGQLQVAEKMRNILSDSALIDKREDVFFNDNDDEDIFKRKVQEYYSLRCLPQILGPILDTMSSAEKIVIDEVNSVSDNPIVDVKTQNVYHGGNFHGDYISLEMDKLKLSITKLSMLAERQIAFLFNDKLNGILPPFVNLGKVGLNLGMQGSQFTATSTTAENQALATSMYIHSITNNNDNQDIVSMGTNSALLTQKVIDNTFQVQSILLIGLLQAVDYLKIENKLSQKTRAAYKKMRNIVPVFTGDDIFYTKIEAIKNYITTIKLNI